MDTKIKPRFWSDTKVENLDANGKLALLWLFTAHISDCGYVECSQKRFEFETGSPWQALLSACQALGNSIITTQKGFLVLNYIREQLGSGPDLARNNMAKSVVRSMKELPAELQAAILRHYPELEALHKPLPSPCASSGSTREERRGEERSKGKSAEKGGDAGGPELEAALGYAAGFSKGNAWGLVISPETVRAWHDHRSSVGWEKAMGENMIPIANWQADLRSYATNAARRNQAGEKKERGGFSSPDTNGGAARPREVLTHPALPEPPCEWRVVLKDLYPPDEHEGADYEQPWGLFDREIRRQVEAEARRRGLLSKDWKQPPVPEA